jgi:hypothetical protein
MLNYNYNIIAPINNKRGASEYRPIINWYFDMRTVAVDAPNMDNIAYATMSIIASQSNATNVYVDSNGFFVGANKAIISASLSGSGVWPTTGSTTMSLFIAGTSPIETPIYYNPILQVSAAENNMYLSGSILTQIFTSPDLYVWQIDGTVVHQKGNPYNPLISWDAKNLTPISNTVPINGYTASFNIVKDANVSLVNIANATGSNSGSFYNDYAFNVTASYTASVNNVTGSTTMSFSIPEAGISTYKTFFNPTTTTAILTGSFSASKNTPYYLTASVIFNKGNISNSTINWASSGSTYNAASFSIVKNVNESLVQNTITSSKSGSFLNDYAFNITSSISGSKNWPDSSSFQALTMSLSIPEIGLYVTSSYTASIITASFAAQTNINPYNITASIELEPYPSYSLSEFLFVGAGGNGANANGGAASGGGGGAGLIITGSGLWIYPNSIYVVNVGQGGGADTYFQTASIQYINARGGGNGAGASSKGGDGGNPGGGSGFTGICGASTNFGPGDLIPGIYPTGSAIAIPSSSGLFVTSSIIGGFAGGSGSIACSGPPVVSAFANAGGGGGATSAGVNAESFCQSARGGGGGFSGSAYLTGSFAFGGASGASPAGLCGASAGQAGANATTIGSGGSGGRGGTTAPESVSGGTGYRGIAIIRYKGPQKGRGGVVTTDGDDIIHTFYESGLFYSTANQLPKQH